jgi:hypothetical protein
MSFVSFAIAAVIRALRSSSVFTLWLYTCYFTERQRKKFKGIRGGAHNKPSSSYQWTWEIPVQAATASVSRMNSYTIHNTVCASCSVVVIELIAQIK